MKIPNAFVIVYVGVMDVLSDLLHRAGARNALVRQLIQRPPWSLAFTDASPLAIVATHGGRASIRLDNNRGESVWLDDGDIALITGPKRYTIADDPSTAPQVEIRGHRKYAVGGYEEVRQAQRPLAARTFGDGLPGATTLLRGAYELHGDVAGRLLDLLPPLAVVPAGPRTRAALNRSPPRSLAMNPARTRSCTGCWTWYSCWQCGHGVPSQRRPFPPGTKR